MRSIIATTPIRSKSEIETGNFSNKELVLITIDEFVADAGALLWIHGHIHDRLDYSIGNTRIICNPRGYPDDRNKNFHPDLIIEL